MDSRHAAMYVLGVTLQRIPANQSIRSGIGFVPPPAVFFACFNHENIAQEWYHLVVVVVSLSEKGPRGQMTESSSNVVKWTFS